MKDSLTPVSKIPKAIVVYELFVGVIETVSALSIAIFGKNILGLYENLKNTELFEDPNDLMFKFMENIIPNLFKHRTYIVLLLFTFGIIKIVSGIGIVYKKIWAEHLLIIFLTILMPFELVGVLYKFSISELIYLITDILIVLILVKFKPVEYYLRLIEDIRK